MADGTGRGRLIGVSVGPGDPGLMTLNAVRAIEQCPVVAVPRTKSGQTLALDIARGSVDMSGKQIVELYFPMISDADELHRAHEGLADIVCAHLDGGSDVALLNLGDASLYGTWSYIADIVMRRGYDVSTIPGVTSFCAAAAVLGQSLTTMSEPLHIVPGSFDDVEENLSLSGSKVLMKSGKALPRVIALIEEKGLADKASLVSNCGLANERVCHDISEASGEEGYFSVILVRP